jgi:hypothetical protein
MCSWHHLTLPEVCGVSRVDWSVLYSTLPMFGEQRGWTRGGINEAKFINEAKLSRRQKKGSRK